MESVLMVGCDLHDRNGLCKVAVGRGDPAVWRFPNNGAGRAGLTIRLKDWAEKQKANRIVFTYEASGCGFLLYDELVAAGIECYVLAPTKIARSLKHARRKTDEKDAELLLELLRGHVLAGNRLPGVWVPDAQTRDDREMTRAREDVVGKLALVKTQIKTLLKRNGIERSEDLGKGWTRKFNAWLKELAGKEKRAPIGVQVALKTLLEQGAALLGQLALLNQAVVKLAAAGRYQRSVDKLVERFEGVGVLSALVFLVEMGTLSRFRNRRQIGSYLGLVPSSQESGEREDCKGHITKQGSAHLRKILCQCAWARARCDPRERAIAEGIKERNPKKKKIAMVALMRRLAIQMWHAANNVKQVA